MGVVVGVHWPAHVYLSVYVFLPIPCYISSGGDVGVDESPSEVVREMVHLFDVIQEEPPAVAKTGGCGVHTSTSLSE